jgi:hypothetical protein
MTQQRAIKMSVKDLLAFFLISFSLPRFVNG